MLVPRAQHLLPLFAPTAPPSGCSSFQLNAQLIRTSHTFTMRLLISGNFSGSITRTRCTLLFAADAPPPCSVSTSTLAARSSLLPPVASLHG